MKARRFFKKLISIRWIVTILIVLSLGIVATVYFTVGISTYNIKLDNIQFDREGFKSFNGIADSDAEKNKLVDENETFKMFIDENTTIVTLCVKDTLLPGKTGNDIKDYGTVYRSGNDLNDDSKANFELSYASTDVSTPITLTFNAYSNSVRFRNVLTGNIEKHYSIKYLNEENSDYKGVQIDYTVGNFGSLHSFFPKNLYATVYKPARVLYSSDAEWEKAVENWETGYLAQVGGRLSNTFDERFRGNVQIDLIQKKLSDGTYKVFTDNVIRVHDEEALIYLRDVVFPEMIKDGIITDAPEIDIENHTKPDRNGNIYWRIKNVPQELINYDSPSYKKYFNNSNSPLTNNPFLTAVTFQQLKDAHNQIYADGKTIKYPYYQANITPGPHASYIYDILYMDLNNEKRGVYNYQPLNPDDEYLEFLNSGYPARDDNDNFIYDENGFVKRQLYSNDQVKRDNELFNEETDGLPVFKVALEFKLTEKGLVVSVPRESIVDSTNYKEKLSKDDPDYELLKVKYQVADIKICPMMTTTDNTQEGYMIVPDGSGAIINFNNGKTSTVSAPYYGKDLAYVDGVKTEDPARLLLGMFGFVNTTPANPGGLLTIIEKGGGQVSLTAGVNVKSNRNFATLTAQLRGREKIKTGTPNASKEFDKWDKIISPSDIVINYQVLGPDETSYSDVAKKYKSYIMERDGLTNDGDKTDKIINDITFLGTFEKYDLFAGVKYKKSDTLTTFKQAMEIIDELGENGVTNLSVNYRGWTNEYLEYEVGGGLKVAGKLGRTAGIRSFYKFCVEKQIPFFPELSIASAKGYDYLFGSTKYTTRGVGNEESIHYSYDLATLRPDKKLSKTFTIAPQFYHQITLDLMKSFGKLKVWNGAENGGFFLTDLGNQWAGNYRKGKQIYGAEAVLYQQDALAEVAKNGKVKISTPCDFAFKYVDTAVNVPVKSAMYTIYDGTIPFYQLVVNGLFDYSTENINGLDNRGSDWYFIKALESGSNLSYLISYEDPAILLNTDYTQYYQAYYKNWKQFIIGATKIADDLGIYGCYLTNHELVGDVSRVTYTSKTNPSDVKVLILNVTDTDKMYNGQVVPSYGFIVEQ